MPRREANPYWEHFDKRDETIAICKYCSQCISYKSTTGNLRSHLKKRHSYILANDIRKRPLAKSIMPRREANPYWEHFDKRDETIAICKYCSQCISYKSTTGNLRSHLKKRHSYILANDIRKRPLAPPPQEMLLQPAQSQEIATTEASANFTTTSSSTAIADLPSSSPSSVKFTVPARKHPLKTKKYYFSKPIAQKMKRKIDRDLLDLFIEDMQPFSMVEDTGFKKLLSWIPGYTPPSKKTISNSLIPTLYEKTSNECREILNAEAVTACITTDCWTSINSDSFIAVTAHYISPKFKLKSILLECKGCSSSHTSDLLAQQIKDIILEWNLPDKVNFAVSDNSYNICNDINQLKCEHYNCFAHSLNLIVKEAITPIQVTIEKVKKIVAHFKRSTQATEKLIKYQSDHLGIEQPKKLVIEVASRWNSTYLMLKRFIELSEAVKATTTVINIEWPVVTEKEWINLELLISVLAPFEEVTSSLSSQNYMTGGLAIVISNSLQDICQEMLQNRYYMNAQVVQNVLLKLKSGLDTRFQNIEKNKSLALCTLLDPRFKLDMFKSDTNKNAIKEHCLELMSGILSRQIPTTTQIASNATVSGSSVWNKVDSQLSKNRVLGTPLSKAIREMQLYLEGEILPRQDVDGNWNDPTEWWLRNSKIYPTLAEIYRSRCNIVITSVPCERIYSEAGYILNERRSRLTSSNLEKLAFLNVNCNFIKNKD